MEYPLAKGASLVLVLAGLCFAIWAGRRWIKHISGQPQESLSGQPIPAAVWLLFVFFGLMCISAGAPYLFFGDPLWLLDRVYSVIGQTALSVR